MRGDTVYLVHGDDGTMEEGGDDYNYGRGYRMRRPFRSKKTRKPAVEYYRPGPTQRYPGPTPRYAMDELDDTYGRDYADTFETADELYFSDEEEERDAPPSLYKTVEDEEDAPSRGLSSLKSSVASEDVLDRQKTLEDAHRKMSASYAGSTARNDMPSRMAARVSPVCLKATAVDEVIKAPQKVILVSESALKKHQKAKMNRNDEDFDGFKHNAVEHMRHLLGFDLSRTRNPNVRSEGEVLILSDDAGVDKVRLAPYLLGTRGSAAIKVTEADGFPSLKSKDPVTESGYALSVIDAKKGAVAHGTYGGKEGKVLTSGQSFYFSELFVYPSNGKYKPEWIRMVSFTPSMVSERNTSRADLSIKRLSLFERPGSKEIKDYAGQATRILKIELLRDAKEAVVAKKVNAVYELKFAS